MGQNDMVALGTRPSRWTCVCQVWDGYCDAQCPHDMKWTHGRVNVEVWVPSETDECTEIHLWEANKISMACSVPGSIVRCLAFVVCLNIALGEYMLSIVVVLFCTRRAVRRFL